MATLIPVHGETTEIAPPKNRKELEAILGSSNAKDVTAQDGSTWWTKDIEPTLNERATKFLALRNGGAPSSSLFGLVLYMSADETRVLKGGTKVDLMVPVYGKTYDVKEDLKKLGAKFNGDQRLWYVPESRLAEAKSIVLRGKRGP